jgi:hypothetical protein
MVDTSFSLRRVKHNVIPTRRKCMRPDVREKLIEVAKRGGTITYGELMKEFGIPRGHRKPGIGIGHVVGDISEHEHDNERPLISAIVVRANSGTTICPKGIPGGGFFGLPGIPSILSRSESEWANPKLTEKEQKFVLAQQQKVWQYWRR